MPRTAIARLVLMALAVSAAGAARPARADSIYTLTDLGTLPGFTYSGSNAVNDSGQVAGSLQDATGAMFHAFLSGPDGGPLTDLGTLGSANSNGLGVNASGQVVGYSNIAGGAYHAFLYSDGRMFDLHDLIAPGSGFTLQRASGISDTGYITGDGFGPDGNLHAFLLTPVPEPSSLVLLGTGAVGLLGYAARQRARPRAGRRTGPIGRAGRVGSVRFCRRHRTRRKAVTTL